MRARLLPLLILVHCSVLAAGKKPILAILDFEAPDAKLGAAAARRLDRRAMEANTHILIDLDDVRLAVEEAELKIKAAGSEKAIQAFAREKLGAHLVMWGSIERLEGRKLRVRVRVMDTHGEPKPYLDETRECANFAAIANFYTAFEDILLKKRTRMRTLTPVSAAAKARDLVQNGSFEKGTWTPAGWSKVDGLTSFWIDRADGKGKCMMFDTEVLIAQAEPWWKKIRAGQATAKDAPKKIPVKPSQIYATVGGLDGCQYYSAWIPIQPKMRYRLTVDIKARWAGIFFPKCFVKGYGDMTDEFTSQKREVYRCYLALRTKTQGKEWETFTRTFNPTVRPPAQRRPGVTVPSAKYMRVMLYSYWPLGKFYWDNIRISEEAVED